MGELHLRRGLTVGLVALAAALLSACGGSHREEMPGFSRLFQVRPSATVAVAQVQTPGLLVITYTFEVAPSYKPDKDATVFLHVVDEEGKVLFQDDHQPRPAMSRWQPGATVTYRRLVYVPPLRHRQAAHLRIGFYDPARPAERFGCLDAAGTPHHGVQTGQVTLLENPYALSTVDGVDTIFVRGWYDLEIDPRTGREWRWSAQLSEASLPKPSMTPALLYLRGAMRPEVVAAGRPLRVTVGTAPPIEVSPAEKIALALMVTPDIVGRSPRLSVLLDTGSTFRPADKGESDRRELGFMLEVLHLQDGLPPGFEAGDRMSTEGFIGPVAGGTPASSRP